MGYPTYVYKLGFTEAGVPSFSQVGQTPETSAGRVGVGIPTITSYGGQIGTGILWMCDPDAGLRAWYAVPGADGNLKSITMPQVNGLNKFQRPVFGDSRLYVTDANGVLYCLGSPVNLPLNCTSPVSFGSVVLGSSKTATVSCTANIPITQISGATTGDPNFIVNTADLPKGAIAQGATFNFPVTWNLTGVTEGNTPNASYGDVQPGVKSTALSLTTVNGVAGFSTVFPISLTGNEVSEEPFAVIAPILVDFGGIVITNTSHPSNSLPFSISNAGEQPLTISGYAYTTDDLDDDEIDFTNATLNQGVWQLGDGFTSPDLPPVGTVIQGNGQVSVSVAFTPDDLGSYQSYFFIFTDGGSPYTIIEGTASSAPVANFSISNGEGGWLPQGNLIMDFGSITPGTTASRDIRICDVGGSTLLISKSKPPNGVFRPDDPTSLHEEQPIPVGECAYATVLFTANNEQPNLASQSYTNTWTLNTDDLNFGVHVVQIQGTVVDRIVGPTNSTNNAVYTYLGCYSESDPAGRLLPQMQYDDDNNTNGRCQTDCLAGNYIFAGTEYQSQCFCGNKPPSDMYLDADGVDCSFACVSTFLCSFLPSNVCAIVLKPVLEARDVFSELASRLAFFNRSNII